MKKKRGTTRTVVLHCIIQQCRGCEVSPGNPTPVLTSYFIISRLS